MRLLIFGGRDFADHNKMAEELRKFNAVHGFITLVIHGNAKGADRLGHYFARNWLMVPDLAFPANWNDIEAPGAVIGYTRNGKPYNKLAGHQRNAQMIIEGKPDIAMGFPGGTGTADILKRLNDAFIPVWNAGCFK